MFYCSITERGLVLCRSNLPMIFVRKFTHLFQASSTVQRPQLNLWMLTTKHGVTTKSCQFGHLNCGYSWEATYFCQTLTLMCAEMTQIYNNYYIDTALTVTMFSCMRVIYIPDLNIKYECSMKGKGCSCSEHYIALGTCQAGSRVVWETCIHDLIYCTLVITEYHHARVQYNGIVISLHNESKLSL